MKVQDIIGIFEHNGIALQSKEAEFIEKMINGTKHDIATKDILVKRLAEDTLLSIIATGLSDIEQEGVAVQVQEPINPIIIKDP